MSDHGEPPEEGATWVEPYERGGVNVSGYWRGKDGRKIESREVSRSPQSVRNPLSKRNDNLPNYVSKFNLVDPIQDGALEDANDYFQSDDMTQYLDDELKGPIDKVKWVLDDEQSGHVEVKTNRDLTPEEEHQLTEWISGQNSDGIGEGFEQMFAYEDVDDTYGYDSDNDDSDEYVMPSFDWQHGSTLTPVKDDEPHLEDNHDNED